MVTKVGIEKLKVNHIDLNFLNVLEERGVVWGDGKIRQTYDEYFEGIHV